MRPGMRMLMITNRRNEESGPSMGGYGPRMNDSPRMGGFSPYMNTGGDYARSQYENNGEARFRDRRGREHYDNGRFAPRGAMDGPDSMDRGYEIRNGGDEGDGMRMSSYDPPRYEEGGGRPMNKIGFSAEPRSHDRQYRQDAGYGGTMEGSRIAGEPPMMGYGKSYGSGKMTREMAQEWTKGMHNEDGSKGPHWTMEQAKQVMTQKGIDCDPVEFWAVLCALYSDYCAVLKKHGINNMDLYVDLAAAWLNDKDAVPNKASMYYECVVKH